MDTSPQPSDLPQRSGSSEPRPKPFDDADSASRKRRRMSASVDSLSNSAGISSVTSSPDDFDASAPTPSSREPTMPHTPKPQAGSEGSPTDAPASSITVSLRNVPQSSSIDSSPTDHGDIPGTMKDGTDDANAAADSEVGLVQNPKNRPGSSSRGSESPPVEFIREHEEMSADVPVEEISIDGQSRYVSDPTDQFPFRDPQETLLGTAERLVHYFSTQPTPDLSILEEITQWLESFVDFSRAAGAPRVAASMRSNQAFWSIFPSLIYTTLRARLHRLPAYRGTVLIFYSRFVELSVYLVKLDLQSILRTRELVLQNQRPPLQLYSAALLTQCRLLTSPDMDAVAHPSSFPGQDPDPSVDDISTLSAKLDTFSGGSFDLFIKLASALLGIIPDYPKCVDALVPLTQILVNKTHEFAARLHVMEPDDSTPVAAVCLEKGHKLWTEMSNCLSGLMARHIALLTTDTMAYAIKNLSTLLKNCLLGTHSMAIRIVEEHRRQNPNLPPTWTPEAIALEYRLDKFGGLVRCGQMQLRVKGTTELCRELVEVWHKLADDPTSQLLKHVASYLLQSGLVEYIISPNSHPEIILESANIVGFLVATKTYRPEHTDRLWKAIASSQDPRVSDALTRMITTLVNLYDYRSLSYLCGKFEDLPLSSFTPSIRFLLDQLMDKMVQKFRPENDYLSYEPYSLCLRVLRESSVAINGTISHPDMQKFATEKLSGLLLHGPDVSGRQRLYQSCLDDISRKTSTTLGSLWVLYIAVKSNMTSEMRSLSQEHPLSQLLVDELEHVTESAPAKGAASVLHGNVNQPRLDFVSNIILHQPSTITDDLGRRLWDLLVGPKSLCDEDREAGWKIFNDIYTTSQGKNPFVRTCLSGYLPLLPVACFCKGALEFVRSETICLVQMTRDFQLDNGSDVSSSCLEQLWRLILESYDASLASQAIHIMAVETYMNDSIILTYPPQRMHRVHSSLVARCLAQVEEAASLIRFSATGGSTKTREPGPGNAMETDTLAQEQVLARSLQLLKNFLEAHRSRPELSAPDLRTLMSPEPSEVAGDLAELKYQSFDGLQQTDIKPLSVGRKNTAGSLLASIRRETGFDNYKAYYRGQPFRPSEEDVCKSLEDLHIHDGLILVKKEQGGQGLDNTAGSSSLQMQIMSRFQEIWEYLDLKDHLAQDIYEFLIELPADGGILKSFENESIDHADIFPPGQPFKSLYAAHALAEYKTIVSRPESWSGGTSDAETPVEASYGVARRRVMTLIVRAILDPEVTSQATASLKLQLQRSLMENLVQWLQEPDLATASFSASSIGVQSPAGLLGVLAYGMEYQEEPALDLAVNTFAAVLRLGLLDANFREALVSHEEFADLSRKLILLDSRERIRKRTLALIHELIEDGECLADAQESETPRPIARYFRDLALDTLPIAAGVPDQCEELFCLLNLFVRKAATTERDVGSLHSVAALVAKLLMDHESSEEIHHAGPFDPVSSGLGSLLHGCIEADESTAVSNFLPRNLAYTLFWRFLFPKTRGMADEPVPKVVLNTETRRKICEVILALVKNDRTKLGWIVRSMNEVMPYSLLDDDPYLYDLPLSFDRSMAVRAPCGYVGLQNLSNTCYLNSLVTQLYMNTSFREFIMTAEIRGDGDRQKLLLNTKKIFGFMQESHRHSIDPTDFVMSIETYDSTQIDIGNQMDVDEFYNLLFDRWEGQLLSPAEKTGLRSFYGGQLVQQIRSKECEHISERVEPFSAIQCDVQGKSCLEESLQAYVDGEVLEGENKYKCSSCDRHVDAVKRACLKDLPDSMIFHLKRFEFNIRTLQRSKINDRFTFPTRINMKPFTAESLNNPGVGGEDMFELVGILVHSGTAETGHYYSFIRERPTASDRPAWIEFNDDKVAPWDPSCMEAATFGGSEGVGYGKSYSAYMLFYQRIPSLMRQQEIVQQGGIPVPVRVPLDKGQMEYILDENTNLLRRHCIFDTTHGMMVQRLFEECSEGGKSTSSSPAGSVSDLGSDSDVSTSGFQGLQVKAMDMVLSHLDQVVSRTKGIPALGASIRMLSLAIKDSAHHAHSFYKYFSVRQAAMRSLVQRNSEPAVRQFTAQLFLQALEKISMDMPQRYAPDVAVGSAEVDFSAAGSRSEDPVLHGAIRIFNYMWKHSSVHIRAWDDHFGLMLQFARLGRRETACLLANDYLIRLCRIVGADAAEKLPPHYGRMLNNVLKRASNNQSTSYVNIIETIDYLLGQLHQSLEADTIVETPGERLDLSQGPFAWTEMEVTFLHYHPQGRNRSFFVEKLVSLDQNLDATGRIVLRLARASGAMNLAVFQTLAGNIRADSASMMVDSFLRVAARYLENTEAGSRAADLASHVAAEAAGLDAADIPAMVAFFQKGLQLEVADVFLARRLHDHCVSLIPRWAPSVLAHHEALVRDAGQAIVDDELFQLPPEHYLAKGGEMEAREESVVYAIQLLGVSCLRMLHEAHVRPKVPITREQAECVVRVVKRCKTYLGVETEAEGDVAQAFDTLQEAVGEPLRNLVVEQIDDDGTDWDGSCASSQQMDGVVTNDWEDGS